ncbi:Hypothetical predicted protein [Paramuricea clavata]|uniref:Uncharacterized protein n=1 Tax=Paramuricea clavata TaxID=317549 RepID=A0A6S7I5A6_PARCT|nr:Hypothetical predicted protein [Paramuricea clavata]
MATDNASRSQPDKNSTNTTDYWMNSVNITLSIPPDLTLEKGKLKWLNNFEDLKLFVKTTLQIEGTWSSPGGYLKAFSEDPESVLIRYYTDTKSLLFQGDRGKKIKNFLIGKIASISQPGGDKHSSRSSEQNSTSIHDDSIVLVNSPSQTLSERHDEDEYALNLSEFESVNTISVDNSSQTYEIESTEYHSTRVSRECNCACSQSSKDIEILKSTITKLQSSIDSFEIILKDHDSVLSMYNRAADMNDKYLKEINESKQHIVYLEQKLLETSQERDSLQLATRLIAQDKYCHHHTSQNEEHNHKSSQARNTQSTHDPSDHSQLDSNDDQSAQHVRSPQQTSTSSSLSKQTPNRGLNGKQGGKRHNGDRKNQKSGHSSRKVTIVGDSMLKNLKGYRMSKENKVKISTFPGSATRDMYDYIKPVLRKKPDQVIIHVAEAGARGAAVSGRGELDEGTVVVVPEARGARARWERRAGGTATDTGR